LAAATEYRCQNLADFTAKDAGSVQCVLIHRHSSSSLVARDSQRDEASSGARQRHTPLRLRTSVSGRSFVASPRFSGGAGCANQGWSVRSARRTDSSGCFGLRGTVVSSNGWRRSQLRLIGRGASFRLKEVVFPEKELVGLLGGNRRHHRPAALSTLRVCLQPNTRRQSGMDFSSVSFCATVLRRAVNARLPSSSRSGSIPLVTREYVFMGYECIVR
jgi:hypothetical protein